MFIPDYVTDRLLSTCYLYIIHSQTPLKTFEINITPNHKLTDTRVTLGVYGVVYVS